MSHHKATWATASVVSRRSSTFPASARGILLHSARSCPGSRDFVPAPTGESWRACHPRGTIPHARRPRRAGRTYTRPCQSTLVARSSHALRVCKSNSGPKILSMWARKGCRESRVTREDVLYLVLLGRSQARGHVCARRRISLLIDASFHAHPSLNLPHQRVYARSSASLASLKNGWERCLRVLAVSMK